MPFEHGKEFQFLFKDFHPFFLIKAFQFWAIPWLSCTSHLSQSMIRCDTDGKVFSQNSVTFVPQTNLCLEFYFNIYRIFFLFNFCEHLVNFGEFCVEDGSRGFLLMVIPWRPYLLNVPYYQFVKSPCRPQKVCSDLFIFSWFSRPYLDLRCSC